MSWIQTAHKLKEYTSQYFSKIFSIDLRSLAIFRIFLGLITFWDFALQVPHLKAFYSDEGFFPLSAYQAWVHLKWMSNIFEFSGSYYYVLFIFIIGMIASLALALGWRARTMALICWFIVIQTHNRNFFILQGGDVIIRCCLFYMIFLPSAVHFNFLSKIKMPSTNKVLSGASVLLISQIAVVYLFAGLHKNNLEWTRYYEAVFNSLQIDNYASAIGIWLQNYPETLALLTKYVVLAEIFVGILLIIPFALSRYLVIAIILGLQFGFFLSFNLGTFPLIGAAISIVLLPAHFWKLEVVQRYILRFSQKGSLLSLKQVPSLRLPVALNIFLIGLALAVWQMNYDSLRHTKDLNTYIRYAMKWVRLDQSWALFAPKPSKHDGWFVMPGKLVSGETIDAYRKTEVSWEKPKVVSKVYPNHKWRKFMIALPGDRYKYFLSTLSYFMCNEWNQRHKGGQQLQEFQIYWIDEPVVYRSQKTKTEKRLLATRKCKLSARN